MGGKLCGALPVSLFCYLVVLAEVDVLAGYRDGLAGGVGCGNGVRARGPGGVSVLEPRQGLVDGEAVG